MTYFVLNGTEIHKRTEMQWGGERVLFSFTSMPVVPMLGLGRAPDSWVGVTVPWKSLRIQYFSLWFLSCHPGNSWHWPNLYRIEKVISGMRLQELWFEHSLTREFMGPGFHLPGAHLANRITREIFCWTESAFGGMFPNLAIYQSFCESFKKYAFMA